MDVWFSTWPDHGVQHLEQPDESTARGWAEDYNRGRNWDLATYYAMTWPPLLPGWSKARAGDAA